MVQWLGLCTFNAGARVKSLVREIIFHKPHYKKKKKKRCRIAEEKGE